MTSLETSSLVRPLNAAAAGMHPALLCFAVNEEFRPFHDLWKQQGGSLEPFEWPGPRGFPGRAWYDAGLVVIVTGMGPRNAEEAGRQAVLRWKPAWLVTSGFAGGLGPDWPRESLIYEADAYFPEVDRFSKAGFRPGRLTCQPKIAWNRESKSRLATAEGADAVEMESGALRRMAAAHGVPSLTARVISDDWQEDLPLDFGSLMDEQQRLHPGRLAMALAKNPTKIPELAAFGKRAQASARRLANALVTAILRREPHFVDPTTPQRHPGR